MLYKLVKPLWSICDHGIKFAELYYGIKFALLYTKLPRLATSQTRLSSGHADILILIIILHL